MSANRLFYFVFALMLFVLSGLTAQIQPVDATSSTLSSWSTGLPPNGTWTTDLFVDDLVNMGIPESRAIQWAGSYMIVFAEDSYGTYRSHSDSWNVLCFFTTELVEDAVRLTFVDLGIGSRYRTCGAEVRHMQWRLDSDGLYFNVIEAYDGARARLSATFEAKPWQKVE